jgi:hypothetical protein
VALEQARGQMQEQMGWRVLVGLQLFVADCPTQEM